MATTSVTLSAVGDNTQRLQDAHDSVKPDGRVLIESHVSQSQVQIQGPLGWCPYVALRPIGQINAWTGLAADDWMHVSTEYGEYLGAQRLRHINTSPISNPDGSFRICNINPLSLANAFHIGDRGSSVVHYGAFLDFRGMTIEGFNQQVVYGGNAFIVNWSNIVFRHVRKRFVYIPSYIGNACERITHDNCTFSGDARVACPDGPSDDHPTGYFENNAGSVIAVDNPNGIDVGFSRTSFDYCKSIIENTPAPYTSFSIDSLSHIEWDADEWPINANDSRVNIRNTGLAYASNNPLRTKRSPFFGAAAGRGVIDAQGIRYLLPSGVDLMFWAGSTDATFLLDKYGEHLFCGPYRPTLGAASYASGVPGYTQLFHGHF